MDQHGLRNRTLRRTSRPAPERIEADAIHCALTNREWGLTGHPSRDLWHAILIASGQGYLRTADLAREDVVAPAMLWLPPGSGDCLHLNAGASGHLLRLSEGLIARAVSGGVDTPVLLYHAGKKIIVSPITNETALHEITHSLQAIERELKREDAGSWTSLAAHISLILVGIWRLSGVEASAPHQGSAAEVLHRFRCLVEMHFRDHWTIPQYADALNTSTDRLHAVCQRVLGRSPLRLVHERLIQQACLLLERSALTVEQISNHLGFSDPAHFQRFFKKHLGEPPGAYRRDTEKAAAERREWRRHSTYADWP